MGALDYGVGMAETVSFEGKASNKLTDNKVLQDHFRSVDSAPKGISVKRPRSAADGFIVTFTALSVLVFSLYAWINAQYPETIPKDLIFFTADRVNAILPIRTFLLVFFLVYALYAHGGLWAKLRLGLSLVGKLVAISAFVDGMAFLSWNYAASIWPVQVQQILVGLVGLAIFPQTILSQARLPSDANAPLRRRGRVWEYTLLIAVTVFAALFAVVMAFWYEPVLDQLHSIALLGGMGPGVFLAQQVLTLTLGVWGLTRNLFSGWRKYSPPIAVLIPAHNEAHLITQTIDAIDEAAAHYDGPVRIVLMDNCSSDDTVAVAQAALDQCRCARGEIIDSPVPGKAKALNHGISLIDEAYIVRIDADTVIERKALKKAMRHFANRTVGAVGGLPLPLSNKGTLSKFRTIEVLNRHGFTQVALGALNGIIGIPGMFVVYRRDVLIQAGGITEEMNGEDTDIVLRMTNLGFRAVSDPRIRFKTEVPESMVHLREQRTRWFRSLYHVTAHNRSILFEGRTITGAVVLPFTLMNGARRAMMAPLAIFGAILYFVYGGVYLHPEVQTVLAVLLGMPFVMACVVVTLWGRPDLVLYMPFYMGFRLLRSYYTLGAVLTLVYPDRASDRAFEAPMPLSRERTPRRSWIQKALEPVSLTGRRRKRRERQVEKQS